MKLPNAMIILDIEATCWEHSADEGLITRVDDNETIEIGALAVSDGEILAEFQTFIRPIEEPVLSQFCKDLTTIEQEWIDKAEEFGPAYRLFRQWCYETAPDAVCMASWGKYDWTQLYKDCLRHSCRIGFTTHLNLKEVYRRKRQYLRSDMGGRKRLGLQSAVIDLGLPWMGTAHRAQVDAHMAVTVYQEMRQRGVVS